MSCFERLEQHTPFLPTARFDDVQSPKLIPGMFADASAPSGFDGLIKAVCRNWPVNFANHLHHQVLEFAGRLPNGVDSLGVLPLEFAPFHSLVDFSIRHRGPEPFPVANEPIDPVAYVSGKGISHALRIKSFII